MIHTPLCDLLEIRHPVVLGGMASGTSVPLVVAVSNAGGLGTLGLATTPPGEVPGNIAAIREGTGKPFGVNFLLFMIQEEGFAAALEAAPPIMAFAWPRAEQDLADYFDRSREAGCKVMFSAGSVPGALRAKAAGADVIVAQGTDGGGHVGWMASMALLPMVVDAVAPTPVVASGGFADGRGLAAALALGAQGVLLGTRFLATVESPLHQNMKQAIVDSDGHDTVLTEIPDLARDRVWPGAMARARRNAFIARWAGREWDLRANRAEAAAGLLRAAEEGDVDNASLLIGQDAGLIHDIPPAGDIVTRIVEEAEEVLSKRLPGFVRNG